MMRITILFLLVSQILFSQKYFTRTGTTDFKASVDAFEPVEAKNNSTSVILTANGEIAAQLFITAFQFRVALMQEHFNENYMDSETFPKASFRGKIKDFSATAIQNDKSYMLEGSLTIKGNTKKISFPAIITSVGKQIVLKGSFDVRPQDFDITIPSLVRKKIAKTIKITLQYELNEKK